MFWVVEFMKMTDGNWSQTITSHETREQAESKYYLVLSYAAVSTNKVHGAVMFDDTGVYSMRQSYNRESQNA